MASEKLAAARAEVGAAVQAHQRSVDAVDEAAAAAVGVNRTDLRCLDLLMDTGAMAPSRLSTELGLTTGSVTAMLDRLERRGYVTRTPDPADRRKVVIEATDEARRKAWAVYGPLAEEGEKILARYTAAELAVITDFLNRSRELQEGHAARVRAM
ncbi:MAG TPA: MarR family transcriptional regulator [Streptosporangiaceae bacterium]|jgi:DNA-binding MarR family transcriptional regulator